MRRRRRVPITNMRVRLLRNHPDGTHFRTRTRREVFVAQESAGVHLPPVLLTGRHVAQSHPDGSLKVYALQLADDDADAIAETDLVSTPLPSRMAQAAHALWAAGLRLPEVAAVLGMQMGTSAMHRVIAAHRSLSPYALRMLDQGWITWGHTRCLTNLAHGQQDEWVGKAVAQKMSVARLKREMEQKAEGQGNDPDTAKYLSMLCQAIGADDLALDTQGGKYVVKVTWSTVEVLQGIFTKIGNAPPCSAGTQPGSVRPRVLSLELDGLDEMDELFGHLSAEW